MRLINATVYLEDSIIPNGFVEIKGGVIHRVGGMDTRAPEKSELDLAGYIVAPGFIDQHMHGADGADTMDGTQEALSRIAGGVVREGVTSFLATTSTMSKEKIHQALQAVAAFKQGQGDNEAKLLGVHLEGPFINPKFKGAQNENYILKPSIKLFTDLQKSSGNSIKLVSYAVESDPRNDFLQYLTQFGVVPSCGHSGASLAQVVESTEQGLLCVTHLHNAMSGHHHHCPGVVSAAYCLDSLKVELIADGIHVHPEILKLVYRIKGSDSIILITDASRAKGLPDGKYDLGGQTFVKEGSACTLESGALAGSVLAMDSAVRNMVKFCGCNLFEAVKMASLNPARLLGVDKYKGSIGVGKDADLVIMDNFGNVRMTIVAGNIVYCVDLATY